MSGDNSPFIRFKSVKQLLREAEVLIIGCDRHPEVPVTVQIKTIKCGYSSFLVKFIITRHFFFKIKECYSTLIYIKFCHT